MPNVPKNGLKMCPSHVPICGPFVFPSIFSPPQASSLSSSSSPSSLRKNMLLDIKERMKRIPFFPLLWFVLTFFPFSALTWTGSVVSVSDGDTITPPSGHMIKAAHRAALYV